MRIAAKASEPGGDVNAQPAKPREMQKLHLEVHRVATAKELLLGQLKIHSLDKRGVENWAQFFSRYDKDRSGNLDKGEFRQILRVRLKIPTKKINDQEINTFFETIDEDVSGQLSIEELCTFLHESPAEQAIRVKRAIKQQLMTMGLTKPAEWKKFLTQAFDKDRSGAVGLEELIAGSRKKLKITSDILPDADLHQFFSKLDADCSGELEMEELIDFVNESESAARERFLGA